MTIDRQYRLSGRAVEVLDTPLRSKVVKLTGELGNLEKVFFNKKQCGNV